MFVHGVMVTDMMNRHDVPHYLLRDGPLSLAFWLVGSYGDVSKISGPQSNTSRFPKCHPKSSYIRYINPGVTPFKWGQGAHTPAQGIHKNGALETQSCSRCG